MSKLRASRESAVLATNDQAPTISLLPWICLVGITKAYCSERGSNGHTRKLSLGLDNSAALLRFRNPCRSNNFRLSPHVSDTRVFKTPRLAVRFQCRARQQPLHVMHACDPTRRINLSSSGFVLSMRQDANLLPCASGARYCSFSVPLLLRDHARR